MAFGGFTYRIVNPHRYLQRVTPAYPLTFPASDVSRPAAYTAPVPHTPRVLGRTPPPAAYTSLVIRWLTGPWMTVPAVNCQAFGYAIAFLVGRTFLAVSSTLHHRRLPAYHHLPHHVLRFRPRVYAYHLPSHLRYTYAHVRLNRLPAPPFRRTFDADDAFGGGGCSFTIDKHTFDAVLTPSTRLPRTVDRSPPCITYHPDMLNLPVGPGLF